VDGAMSSRGAPPLCGEPEALSAGISTYSYHPRRDRAVPNSLSVWGSEIGYDTLTIFIFHSCAVALTGGASGLPTLATEGESRTCRLPTTISRFVIRMVAKASAGRKLNCGPRA